MATEGEPTDLVKITHLLILAGSWGMQLWVTFVSGACLSLAQPSLEHDETDPGSGPAGRVSLCI
ncbi:Transmembrane protein 205 [Acipenser ruthenus]|uniref:Transmembrane protein 205 n=1 Tax=Acipenser ruthenus TaxID=7906 RepID=A0A444UT64_ACIRT|nr:Transmembrane protein 205 [Acipenser ruthenus]